MNIAFKIPPVSHLYSDMHLLAEAGKEEISFLIFSKNPFALHGFYAFSFARNIEPAEYAETVKHIVHKEHVLQQEFSSCHIFYNGDESVLVPAQYFVEADKEKLAALMFGENSATACFHENVKDNGIKNVYRVPQKIYDAMNAAFPKSSFSHACSSQLMDEGHTDTLRCIVYHNNIKIILFKDSKLQAVRYAEYLSPSDVCYHLLNTCEQFGVQPEIVQLILSGMVDEHSNLYKEIYRYFLLVSFGGLPEGISIEHKLDEQPHHFYSHLVSLAQCV